MRECRDARYAYFIAQSIATLLATNLLVCAALFAIGIALSWVVLPGTIVATALISRFVGRLSTRDAVVSTIAAAVIIALCSVVCSMGFDASYDGNAYHKVAVGLLKAGWIPPANPDSLMQSFGFSSGRNIWLIHYCKQPWYYGASIYSVASTIECGKSYTLVSMIMAALVAYAIGVRFTKRRSVGAAFAVVSALNPIAVSQWMTYYIDGYLQVVLWVLVLSLYASYAGLFSREGQITPILIASTMIVVGNIKFTGLAFGGAYCIVFFLLSSVRTGGQRNRQDARAAILRSLGLYLLLAVVTVFWGGMQTYLPNTLEKGHPLWPLAGEGAVDIMTPQTPPALLGKGRLHNLLCSLFCEANNSNQASGFVTLTHRVPLTVSEADANVAKYACDIRVGGFGPFFGVILVASLVILLIYIARLVYRRQYRLTVLPVALIVLSAVFTYAIKESWWARYAPYLYFIPLFSFMMLCGFPQFGEKPSKEAGRCAPAFVLAVVLALNAWQMVAFSANTFAAALEISSGFEQMSNAERVKVSFGDSRGTAFNFRDYGCQFTAEELPNDAMPFYYGMLRIED